MRSAETRRAELELRQRSLVAALVAGSDPPPDMDAERIRVQATALIRKRGRIVARARPELAAVLGLEFGLVFHDYVTSQPGRGHDAAPRTPESSPVTCSAPRQPAAVKYVAPRGG